MTGRGIPVSPYQQVAVSLASGLTCHVRNVSASAVTCVTQRNDPFIFDERLLATARLSANGVTATCADEGGCGFHLKPASVPLLLSVTPAIVPVTGLLAVTFSSAPQHAEGDLDSSSLTHFHGETMLVWIEDVWACFIDVQIHLSISFMYCNATKAIKLLQEAWMIEHRLWCSCFRGWRELQWWSPTQIRPLEGSSGK